jgi:hypothetical protein
MEQYRGRASGFSHQYGSSTPQHTAHRTPHMYTSAFAYLVSPHSCVRVPAQIMCSRQRSTASRAPHLLTPITHASICPQHLLPTHITYAPMHTHTALTALYALDTHTPVLCACASPTQCEVKIMCPLLPCPTCLRVLLAPSRAPSATEDQAVSSLPPPALRFDRRDHRQEVRTGVVARTKPRYKIPPTSERHRPVDVETLLPAQCRAASYPPQHSRHAAHMASASPLSL